MYFKCRYIIYIRLVTFQNVNHVCDSKNNLLDLYAINYEKGKTKRKPIH